MAGCARSRPTTVCLAPLPLLWKPTSSLLLYRLNLSSPFSLFPSFSSAPSSPPLQAFPAKSPLPSSVSPATATATPTAPVTFSSLLLPSLNPFNTVVDLLCSRLKHLHVLMQHQQQQQSEEELLLESHLLPFLQPPQISLILLRSQSLPLPSLLFFRWAQSRLLRPSPENYSILIHILAYSKHFSHVLVLIPDFLLAHPQVDAFDALVLLSGGCNRNPQAVFGMLVKVFVKMRRLGDALQTCRKAISMGFSPDVNAFNCLLDGLVKSDALELCWDVHDEMRQIGIAPNLYTFNILIHALCQGEDTSRARDFLEEMESEGFDPDVVTYNTLIAGYCTRERLDDAFYLYKIMYRRGVEPDLVSYTTLMSGLCKVNRVVEAHQLFDKMLQRGILPDSFSYSVLIAGHSKTGRLREARFLVHQMLSRGLRPDGFTCDIIVEAHVKAGRLLPCLNLIALLRVVGTAITFDIYRNLLDALCGENRPNAARNLLIWMLQDGHEPTVAIYNQLIASFCKCGSLKEVLCLKDEMVDKHLNHDLDTYQIIINFLCAIGKPMDAERLMTEMFKWDLKPDNSICAYLVNEYCKQKNFCKVESILKYFVDEFHIHDRESYNTLIKSYCEDKKFSELIMLQDRMLQLGFVPNGETCKSLIYSLAKDRD